MPEALITQELRKQANNKATASKKQRRHQEGGLKQQSPGERIGERVAFREQVERYDLVGNPMYKSLPNQQIHHIKQAAAFNGLFANTTEDEARQLANVLGSGNKLQNLINVLPSEHQGGYNTRKDMKDMALHPNLMRKGLAMNSAKAVKHELFEEMDMAANSSFAYKMHLAQRFNKELLPKILEATDESLTYHAQQRGEDTVYNKRMMARDTARQSMGQRLKPL